MKTEDSPQRHEGHKDSHEGIESRLTMPQREGQERFTAEGAERETIEKREVQERTFEIIDSLYFYFIIFLCALRALRGESLLFFKLISSLWLSLCPSCLCGESFLLVRSSL